MIVDRAPTLVAYSYVVVEIWSVSGTSGTGGTGVLGNATSNDGDSWAITAVNASGANVGSVSAGTDIFVYNAMSDSTGRATTRSAASTPASTLSGLPESR